MRKIADGGMGSVYEARQENPRRAVALKVIRAELLSEEILRRFEHEAQILGRLQHPGIAQIYEAGWVETPAGRQPYFEMEFIAGVSLTEFARTRNLDLRARLELFVRVCEAVHHAHQKGVIHRDLKPGNILVEDSGQPKVLDFGVARATNSDVHTVTIRTDVGQLLGTLPYMSPEQVAADPAEIDTRSDVYALGVILHELLTGRMPYDLKHKVLHEAVRIIREVEPSTIGSESRAFRGDLETTVSKALEKERDRRYGSASEFATDIQRHLRDEPIIARPPSVLYQARKFARRNKALVGGIAGVFLALVAGTIVSVNQAIKAADARDLAEERLVEANLEARRFKTMNSVLRNMFGSASPMRTGRDEFRLRELLDSTRDTLDRGTLAQEPDVEAPLRETLADMYDKLTILDEAEIQSRKALELLLPETSKNEVELARVRVVLARNLNHQSRMTEAMPLVESAMRTLEAREGRESESFAHALSVRSSVLYNLGQKRAAVNAERAALDILKRLPGRTSDFVLSNEQTLGFLLSEIQEFAEAESVLRSALDARELQGGANSAVAAQVRLQPARVLTAQGRSRDAEPLLLDTLRVWESISEGRNTSTADASLELANVYVGHGETNKAEPLARKALELRREILGDHRDTAVALGQVANVESLLGRFPEAETLLLESLEMRTRIFGARHSATADSWRALGMLKVRTGQLAEAEMDLRLAVEIWRETLEPGNSDLGLALLPLARLLRKQGSAEEATRLARESFELYAARLGPIHPKTMENRDEYVLALLDTQDWTTAERLLNETLPILATKLRTDHPLLFYGRIELGYALSGLGRHDEAIAESLAGWNGIKDNKALFKETVVQSLHWLAAIHEAAGKPTEAAAWREQALDASR